MIEKIKELLASDENIAFGKIAKELNVPMIEVLRNAPAPKVRKYSVEKMDELFAILNKWDKVLLLVITPGFVLEIKDKFPKGTYGHGFLNFHDPESGIGGHFRADSVKEIFMVTDNMHGKDSCSIKFFDGEGKDIMAVYVPRNEKRELIPEYLEVFNSL